MQLTGRHKLALGLAGAGVIAALGFFLLLGRVFVWGESRPGTIVGERRSSQGSCAPIVEYNAHGKKRRSETRVFTACGASEGEPITVHFWPDSPDEATVFTFSNLFVPVLLPLALFVAALSAALAKPKMKEILEQTPEALIRDARPGQLVKIRGKLELAGPPVISPLTGRSAVASWSRVSRRSSKQPDQGVQDETRFSSFVVRDATGAVRVTQDTPLRLRVTAELDGSTELSPSPAVEAFLKSHGHADGVADTALHHYVWYEAIFSEGDSVVVVGVVTPELTLAAPDQGSVIVSRDG